MPYDDEKMALTKERLDDLRKGKKLSFEQLSKLLDAQGTPISHTNLRNYEINDSLDQLYTRTKGMSIENLVALAEIHNVSIDYLLGLSDSEKREYYDISSAFGLCDEAIDTFIAFKENSEKSTLPKGCTEIEILNNFLTSQAFQEFMKYVGLSLFAYKMYLMSKSSMSEATRERDKEKINEGRQLMNKYGYFPVENNTIATLHMETAISELRNYLKQLPELLVE